MLEYVCLQQVRIFNGYLHSLLDDLRNGAVFGRKAVYLMYVVEFQKRGLPHAHICLRVEGEQPRTAEEIDRHIRAEIPVVDEHSPPHIRELHKLVKTHMIHGCYPERCFAPSKNPAAGKRTSCKNGFPYDLQDTTTVDEGRSKVLYRRRNPGDSDVASYNPVLLLKYRCHINVQHAEGIRLIKYMRKYMCKVSDCAATVCVGVTLSLSHCVRLKCCGVFCVCLPQGMDRTPIAVAPVDPAAAPAAVSNEYKTFQMGRHISATEAAWRLAGKVVNKTEPAVKALPCHLPDEDFVVFSQDDEAAAVAGRTVSALQRYFCRPAGDAFDGLTMVEYYEQYTVSKKRPAAGKEHDTDCHPDPGKRCFVWKSRGTRVCRLFRHTPKHGDVYYLRKLLMYRPARSYEDLVTVGDEVLRVELEAGGQSLNFQGAVRRLGLLFGDSEFEDCMQEAVTALETPMALRYLFVQLTLEFAGAAPMLQKFGEYMSYDIVEHVHRELAVRGTVADDVSIRSKVFQRLLAELEDIFESSGRTMTAVGLPMPAADAARVLRITKSPEQHRAEFENMFATANDEQKAIFDTVRLAIESGNGGFFFVDGPSGRGKTFLLRMLIAWCFSIPGRTSLNHATCGIVAVALHEGITCHRGFGLPLDVDTTPEALTCNVPRESYRAKQLKAASLIILDELPMLNKAHFELIDKCLRTVTGVDRPFGGKTVVGGGDFRQTTPVVKHGGRAATVSASVKASELWCSENVRICPLTQPMRDGGDPEWSAWVSSVGDGAAEYVDPVTGLARDNQPDLQRCGGSHSIKLPPGARVFTDVAEARAWIHTPDELGQHRHSKTACQRAVLAPHNASIQDHNEFFLERIPGEAVRLHAAEKLDVEHGSSAEPMIVSEEFMARMHDTGAPDHTVTLKPGCLIMCLRNLSPQLGVLNGTLLEVVSVAPGCRFIVANTLSEPPVRVLIPRIKFKLSVPGGAVQVERLQFPVRLAYGMTINKSQGKTLLRVLLDLRCEVFGHGQLYVGTGRVTCAAHIAFLVSPDRIRASLDGEVVLTSNVVYPELLSGRGVDVAPVFPAPVPPAAEPRPYNVLDEWNAPAVGAPDDWDVDA